MRVFSKECSGLVTKLGVVYLLNQFTYTVEIIIRQFTPNKAVGFQIARIYQPRFSKILC